MPWGWLLCHQFPARSRQLYQSEVRLLARPNHEIDPAKSALVPQRAYLESPLHWWKSE